MAIAIRERIIPRWKPFHRNQTVSVAPAPLRARDVRFFVMGSCFAEEIRLALEAELGRGTVGPIPAAISFDPERVQVDGLPDRNHLNTYNPLSVLQELQRIRGVWSSGPDDFWSLEDRVQCPFRRLVFAPTPEELAQVTRQLDTILRRDFEAADHFVFTFGMTEVFIDRASGRAANQKPGYGQGGGRDETDYRRMSFADCLETMIAISGLIGEVKPRARIFVTVSPVPLKRTFSGEDIAVANTRSKSTLRAALAEAAQYCANLVYFPSYEAVMAEGPAAFGPDGRHVRRPLVEGITRAFVAAHLTEPLTA